MQDQEPVSPYGWDAVQPWTIQSERRHLLATDGTGVVYAESSHGSLFNVSSLEHDIEDFQDFIKQTLNSSNNSLAHAKWNCEDVELMSENINSISSHLSHYEEHYCSDHGTHYPEGQYFVLYVAFVLFLGCVFRWMGQKYRWPIPYTVVLLTLGVVIEIWEYYEPAFWGDLALGFQGTLLMLFLHPCLCFACLLLAIFTYGTSTPQNLNNTR